MAAETSTNVAFCSSLQENAWHDVRGPGAFEAWHFDAMSDDGREVLVVEFYDNYVLSPRFFECVRDPKKRERGTSAPAVCLVYSVDGQVIVGAINEFSAEELKATRDHPHVTIGRSSFTSVDTEYGKSIRLNIDLASFGGRRIKADLEWLLIESDLLPLADGNFNAVWDLTAPRADVSGRLELIGRLGKTRRSVEFRATGFHDHILSRDEHYRDLSSRMWGRAHFPDATVVFERHGGVRDPSAPGEFFVIKDGKISEYHAECHATEHKRNVFGIWVPRRIAYMSNDGTRIRVKPLTVIRSDFCEVKMLSSVTLTLNDGQQRESIGITEFVDPGKMQSGVVRRLGDLRIGKNGRSGLF